MATTVVPFSWIVLGLATGVLLSGLRTRLPPMKVAFNVAKESLIGATASGVMFALGAPPAAASDLAASLPRHLAVMPVAALAYAVVDEILFFPVIAVATGTSVRRRFLEHWDVRLVSRIAGLAMGIAATVVITIDQWLLLALPPLLYALHLMSASRLRSREEREAWQRLARSTDELNAVDLDGVLHTAVIRAAELFSADEVEIETEEGVQPARLVRGDEAGI